MKLIETSLPGVSLIEPVVYGDERGFFFETYHRAEFARLGISDLFVQDNHSKSFKGALRGLHYQLRNPQAKLCRVIQGAVLDVVVDIRRGSPHFGKYEKVLLSADNKLQIYIPAGFAHGFLALSETAEFLYKCSDFYDRQDEYGIAWDDPQIAIDWNIENPVLSEKDRKNRPLSEIPAQLLPAFESR